MSSFLPYLVMGVAGAVLFTLMLGVFNMLRDSDKASKTSQKLMRWRIGLQALALILLVAAYISKHHA
jgi:hypothetical protein